MKLFKLHGSMNWYIPLKGQRRTTAFDPRAPIYVPNPPSDPNRPGWKYRKTRINNQNIFPLIVPPVFEKGTHLQGHLRRVWERARDALRHASLVIMWGYSLPETDYHAEMLFAQCARSSRYDLAVVNPDHVALSRVTDVCGHVWTRWFFRIEHLFQVLAGQRF